MPGDVVLLGRLSRRSGQLGRLAAKVCRPVRKDGTRYRALRPWSDQDRRLLESISDGKLAVGGLCNRDVARQLYPPADDDPSDRRRIASKVSYRLRILRAHGLILMLTGVSGIFEEQEAFVAKVQQLTGS